ncbi:MAG: sigma-70 family RNA polymerase sigma factor [Candidatus Omnitrophota bacterium]
MNESYFEDKIVRKYSNLVYTAIDRRLKGYGIVLPREDILDIRQEVLISLWEGKKLDTIRDTDSIPYWIAIVSGNTAIQYIRRTRRIEPEKPIPLSDKLESAGIIDMIPSSGMDPSEELDKYELSGRIDDAIDSLPVKEKLIVKLNLLHGKKYSEIAEILRLPAGTVSNCILRAKEKIKAHLSGSG